MLEKLQKYYSPLILSVILHVLIILALAYGFSSLNSKKSTDVGVSIISSQSYSKICQKQEYAVKKKFKHKHIAKSKGFKSDQNNKKNKDLDNKKQKKVNDLSYTKDVYKIGSRNNPAPPYPRIAKIRNIQGLVEICIISDANGNVINAEVHRSSGYSTLDRSALRTVKDWKLSIGGGSEDKYTDQLFRVIVPINFVMNN